MADQGQSREQIWASEMSLALLGPLRLGDLAGEELTPKARKTRAVLAIVALARGPVSRARLSDLLWGDRGDEQAKASLRQALYELKAATPPGVIVSDRQSVSLGPKKLPTDIGELERMIATGDASGVADMLDRAAWPLLADLDGVTSELDEWLREERARTGAAIVNGSLEVADGALASEPSVARRIADAVERIDPLEERAAQAGIRADLGCGDRAAAVRRHARFAARLREELGVEPGPDTQALLADARAPAPPARNRADTAAPVELKGRRRWLASALVLVAAAAAALLLFLFRPGAEAATPTVAVLPFEHSGAAERAYVASGVSDEILNLLADQRQVRVLGRVSSVEIGAQPDSLEAARRLGITHLVDGTVQTAQDRVVVIVRMTRVADGSQLWSERYERQLGDIFAVQGDIAASVASRLALSFAGAPPQGSSPEVYERYLAARQLVRERRQVTLMEAERLLRDAIRLDPQYAPAHAELSQVLMLLADHPASYGTYPLEQARAQAERFARRAIALDPNLGEGYAALGFLSLDPNESTIPHYRKAVELSPQRPEFHRWLGQSLFESGRYEEGLAEYRRAVAIDPLWGVNYDHLIAALYRVGYREEGMRYARRFLSLSTDPRAKILLLQSLAKHDGRTADWLRYSKAFHQAHPDEKLASFYMTSSLAALGERQPALRYVGDNRIGRAVLSANWAELAAASRATGANFWEFAGDFWNVPSLLVASGNARVLVELYDRARTEGGSGAANGDARAGPEVIVALREVGRDAEAERLLQQFRQESERLPRTGEFGERRSLHLAFADILSGAPERAFAPLERMASSQPMAMVPIPLMSLRHDPVFRSIAGDPRLDAIDERLRAAINRQRELAGLPALSKAQWVSDRRILLTKN